MTSLNILSRNIATTYMYYRFHNMERSRKNFENLKSRIQILSTLSGFDFLEDVDAIDYLW